ncbi:hypothetical protein J6590_034678 [Homalodisca vitripennis]|nr:hypothetical protein J6590_034678 [Homalodisca vitripennis]
MPECTRYRTGVEISATLNHRLDTEVLSLVTPRHIQSSSELTSQFISTGSVPNVDIHMPECTRYRTGVEISATLNHRLDTEVLSLVTPHPEQLGVDISPECTRYRTGVEISATLNHRLDTEVLSLVTPHPEQLGVDISPECTRYRTGVEISATLNHRLDTEVLSLVTPHPEQLGVDNSTCLHRFRTKCYYRQKKVISGGRQQQWSLYLYHVVDKENNGGSRAHEVCHTRYNNVFYSEQRAVDHSALCVQDYKNTENCGGSAVT